MSLNVNRNLDDAFYRYKMPPVIAKVEGKGNGIKTVIVNMGEIAKALQRPAGYPTKYFGCELGAQTMIDAKTDRYIVNGQHESKRLQELLDGFIQKFVLCEKCGNPETNMYVTKSDKIEENCLACGHITACDMRHKLTTYILKNPPDGVAPKASSKATKKTKAERRQAKHGKHDEEGGSNEDEEQPEASSPPVATPTTTSPPAVADDDWSVDTSEEAVRQRAAQQLTAGVAALTITDDLERSGSERLELFRAYLQPKMKETKFPAKEVLTEAERLDCKEKASMAVIELGFDSEDYATKLKTYGPIIQRLTHENPKAQKYVIGALERYIDKFPKLVDKFASILKAFYDIDVVEEKAIFDWDSKISKKYVSKELATKLHEKAQPLIKWLREAEEESSEEEDDEVEVSFAGGAAASTAAAAASTAATTATITTTTAADDDDEPAAEEDDLDIDAI